MTDDCICVLLYIDHHRVGDSVVHLHRAETDRYHEVAAEAEHHYAIAVAVRAQDHFPHVHRVKTVFFGPIHLSEFILP